MHTFGPKLDGYYDVEDQFIDYLRRRAERSFRRREQERQGLTSLPAFEAYRQRMRRQFLYAIGGLPEERTPLRPRISGVLDRGDYEIRKLSYESLPDFPVTAALYMPRGRAGKGPGPAILFVCGHAQEAKAYPTYQQVCIDLALEGFVVLAIDPPGQGERMQYLDRASGEQQVRWGVVEHSYSGMQYYLIGASLARQFVWDGIRGLDYLASLPEVDAQRIGVTGNSGGGTQTVFLMLAEPRLAAAMPCTFVMDYESYLKTGQSQDAEQNLFGSFLEGPDHDDYLTAMAPRPVRVGLAAYDFFPVEGALAALEKARKVYALLGAEEHLDYRIAPTVHKYSALLREAAVNFFRKTLRGEAETFRTAEPQTLEPRELEVVPGGQVLTAFPNCRTVSDLVRDELLRCCPASPRKLDPKAIRHDLAERLGIGSTVPAGEASWLGTPRMRPIHPRVIDESKIAGYACEKIFFFSEPDVICAAVLVHPRAGVPVLGTELHLLPGGTDSIPAHRARLTALLEEGLRIFLYDVRGVGAVKSRGVGQNYSLGNEFKLGCDAFKLKTSTLGLRVFDVLRGLDYLRTRPELGPVSLSGHGPAAAWALYAAVLETGFEALTLERQPLSYRQVVSTRLYDPGTIDFRSVAWGQLRSGDVIDLLPALAPRRLTLVTPLGADGQPLAGAAVERQFLAPAEAAGLIGAEANGWRPHFQGLW